MIVNVSCRIRVLTEQIENESKDLAADQSKDVLVQKEEMIKCLQNELIKVWIARVVLQSFKHFNSDKTQRSGKRRYN